MRPRAAGSSRPTLLAPLRASRARLCDQLDDAIELLLGKAGTFSPKERTHDLLDRAVEERIDDVAQRGLSRRAAGHRRRVYELTAALLVTHVPFPLEHTQLRPDCRIAALAGELAHDFFGR